jgi:hypothetical protein
VRAADGTPVPRARIHAYDASGLLVEGGIGFADEQGRFTIPDVAAGEIHVAASDDRGAVSAYVPVEVRPEQTSSVDLALAPGTWLWVRALAEDKAPVAASIQVVDSAGAPQVLFEHEKEAWWYGLVPPGRYVATARSGARTATGSIVVASGEEARSLELALE